MKLTLIAAVAGGGVIGRDGDLPWRLRADLAQFKRRTLGHPIVMGRKTWESLPKRPLKDRLNVVVTRQADYVAEGATVVSDVEAAVEAARASGAEEAFVIGGATLYAATLPHADRLVITHVDADVPGDVTFPDVDWDAWRVESREEHAADEKNEHAFAVVVYER
ncbi:MAG: dihydrofolate reductase [Sandaracinaceae bacterium]|nr:dihydrofolate reductase [Sandaracinaceae bacterium]